MFIGDLKFAYYTSTEQKVNNKRTFKNIRGFHLNLNDNFQAGAGRTAGGSAVLHHGRRTVLMLDSCRAGRRFLTPPDDAQFLDGLTESRRDGAVGAVNILDSADGLVVVSMGAHQVLDLTGLGTANRRAAKSLDDPLGRPDGGNCTSCRTGATGGTGRKRSRTSLRLVGVDQPGLDVIPWRRIGILGE